MEVSKTMGRVAFEHYKTARNGKAFDGSGIPQWNDLSVGVQAAWQTATVAAINVWEKTRGKVEVPEDGRMRNTLIGILESMYATELLEYYDKNLLSGDNKTRCEWKQERLRTCVEILKRFEL